MAFDREGRPADPRYDWGRLERALMHELSVFIPGVEDVVFDSQTELRGLALAWFSTFLPECVTPEFASKLRSTVEDLRAHPGWRTKVWYRAFPLEVSLFALEGCSSDLESLIANQDHGKSTLRHLANECLAYVIDRIAFGETDLADRVWRNIGWRHAGADNSLLLLMATKGGTDEKKHFLQRVVALEKDHDVKDLAERLLAGQWVQHSSFPSGFADALLGAVCALLEAPELPPRQADLFSPGTSGNGTTQVRPQSRRSRQPCIPGLEGLSAAERLVRGREQSLCKLDALDVMNKRFSAHPLSSGVFRVPEFPFGRSLEEQGPIALKD